MKMITFADGMIRLGGEELPGILQQLRIDGKVRYDSQQVDGSSGASKTPQGWEDHTLSATLVLATDETTDCYEKLAHLVPFFKKPDPKANPQIYTIANRHAQVRGIRLVVFDRLESSENSKNDTISVSLGFVEHKPPIIRTEAAVAKTPTPEEMEQQAENANNEETSAPVEDASIIVDLD